jgi:hypothetical protein
VSHVRVVTRSGTIRPANRAQSLKVSLPPQKK